MVDALSLTIGIGIVLGLAIFLSFALKDFRMVTFVAFATLITAFLVWAGYFPEWTVYLALILLALMGYFEITKNQSGE